MTNTDTADVEGTVAQVAALALAGSELVRVTVNNDEAAAAVPAIVEGLERWGLGADRGDFHYNGHLLLTSTPTAPGPSRSTASIPATWAASARDEHFRAIIEVALQTKSRCASGSTGVARSGPSDEMMDGNAGAPNRVMRASHHGAMVESALRSARLAEKSACPRADPPPAKVSRGAGPGGRLSRAGRAVRLSAAPRPDRGGDGDQGHGRQRRRARDAAAGRDRRYHPCLAHAHARRRSHRRSARRAADAAVARDAELHPAGHRCPGCGRTTSTFFQQMAEDIQGYLGSRCRSGKPLARCRGAAGRGDGMRRERPGRIEARQPRDFAARAPSKTPRRRSTWMGGFSTLSRETRIVAEFLGILNQYVENRYGAGDNGGMAEWRNGGMAAAPTQADTSA